MVLREAQHAAGWIFHTRLMYNGDDAHSPGVWMDHVVVRGWLRCATLFASPYPAFWLGGHSPCGTEKVIAAFVTGGMHVHVDT